MENARKDILAQMAMRKLFATVNEQTMRSKNITKQIKGNILKVHLYMQNTSL